MFFGQIVGGEILFIGKDGVQCNFVNVFEVEMCRICGNDIFMIFQELMISFNLVYIVGDQIVEVVVLYQGKICKEVMDVVIDMLCFVGILVFEKCVNEYFYQMLGGMCQCVMIVMVFLCKFVFLIVDELIIVFDVIIQVQILDLMCNL